MKFADLIKTTRDGAERPLGEQKKVVAALEIRPCATCKKEALCAYYIQMDAFYCSHECYAERA